MTKRRLFLDNPPSALGSDLLNALGRSGFDVSLDPRDQIVPSGSYVLYVDFVKSKPAAIHIVKDRVRGASSRAWWDLVFTYARKPQAPSCWGGEETLAPWPESFVINEEEEEEIPMAYHKVDFFGTLRVCKEDKEHVDLMTALASSGFKISDAEDTKYQLTTFTAEEGIITFHITRSDGEMVLAYRRNSTADKWPASFDLRSWPAF